MNEKYTVKVALIEEKIFYSVVLSDDITCLILYIAILQKDNTYNIYYKDFINMNLNKALVFERIIKNDVHLVLNNLCKGFIQALTCIDYLNKG